MSEGRGIDHLVLACRDLGATAETYRRLGFQVGARNRHPWGTENHIVQLQGSFLELIGLGEGFTPPPPEAETFPFAGFLSGFLGRREGLAMLVLESRDAAADYGRFAGQGIGIGSAPFRFGRTGRRPDGTETEVAFSLAFARSRLIREAGFFVCQQHFPENFWNPAFQAHPNTAVSVLGAVMVADNPAQHAEFLSGVAGEREMRATSAGIEIETPRGRIDALTPTAFRFRFGVDPYGQPEQGPHFAAFRIGVRDLAAVAERLDRETIGFDRVASALVVPASEAHGCVLAFENPD